jgi:hypothetical protein
LIKFWDRLSEKFRIARTAAKLGRGIRHVSRAAKGTKRKVRPPYEREGPELPDDIEKIWNLAYLLEKS